MNAGQNPRQLELEPLNGFANTGGKGARAEVAGKTVLLGNRRLMDEGKVDMTVLNDEAARLQSSGQAVVHVAHGGNLVGLIAIADVLPSQKADKIKVLQATGKKVGMVGDEANDAPVLAISGGSGLVAVDVPLFKRTRLEGIRLFRFGSAKASGAGNPG